MLNEIDECKNFFNEASKLRDIARTSSNKHEYYKKSALKFDEYINFIVRTFICVDSDKIELIRMMKEQGEYERDFCFFMYYLESSDYVNAKEYLPKAFAHIKNAIACIEKYESSVVVTDCRGLRHDKKRWTFYLKQFDLYSNELKSHESLSQRDYGNAIDYCKLAIDSVKNLLLIIDDYTDVLEPEYIRFVNSLYFTWLSNYSKTLYYAISTLYSDDEKHISEEMFLKSLKELWNSYLLSEKAFIENPIYEQNKDELEDINSRLKDALLNNTGHWHNIYIYFNDDKEFLKFMKKLDSKLYNNVENNMKLSGNKSFKLWSIGSFFVFLFVFVIGGITLTAKILSSFWILLISLVFCEIILVIIGGFVLRVTGDLSEVGLLKIFTIAFKNQFAFLKTANKKDENLNS